MNKVLRIEKKDLNDKNEYREDSLVFDGDVVFAPGLGRVVIRNELSVTKSLTAEAGSGIEAGWGVKAGDGIEAGSGVKAGWGIEAGDGIITLFGSIIAEFVSCLRVCVGFHSKEEQTITAEIRNGQVILGRVVAPTKKEAKVK